MKKTILKKIVIKLLELPFVTIKLLSKTMVCFYLPKGVSENQISIIINDDLAQLPILVEKAAVCIHLALGNNEEPVLYTDIMYFKKRGNDTEVVIHNRRAVFIPMPIKKLNIVLPAKLFHMIKSNCIVAFAYIIDVDGGQRGYTHMTDKAKHLNSRERKPEFLKQRKQNNTD